jgi:hypothetical protein
VAAADVERLVAARLQLEAEGEGKVETNFKGQSF